MTDPSKDIAGLDPKKRELLARLLAEQGVDVARRFILPQPRVSNALPLSFAQQRLWFLHQLQPDSPAYTIPSPMRLQGPLDLAALRRTFDAIMRRHETLRTT